MNARCVDEKTPVRAYYPKKPVLDVAFVAHKNMPEAPNNGFPHFRRLTRILSTFRVTRPSRGMSPATDSPTT